MATAARRLLSVEEFLEIEFDLESIASRVELDNGIVTAMAGGSAAHARVQANIFGALFVKLRGSGCRPYGSDMGVRTHDLSLRYPDVSVFCGREGPENDDLKQFDDPKLIVEVLSPATRHKDEGVKLSEYQTLSSLDAIVYVDPDHEAVTLIVRTSKGGWQSMAIEKGSDVELAALGTSLPWSEIFSRN
jgi:Uma2 family endonuclease